MARSEESREISQMHREWLGCCSASADAGGKGDTAAGSVWQAKTID